MLEPKSPHALVYGEKEKEGKKEAENFVKMLDAQLLEDNNIPIGDIVNVGIVNAENDSVPVI